MSNGWCCCVGGQKSASASHLNEGGVVVSKTSHRLAFEPRFPPPLVALATVVWVEGDSCCHDGKGDPPQSHWYLCNWLKKKEKEKDNGRTVYAHDPPLHRTGHVGSGRVKRDSRYRTHDGKETL